jgi:hypothetical protein
MQARNVGSYPLRPQQEPKATLPPSIDSDRKSTPRSCTTSRPNKGVFRRLKEPKFSLGEVINLVKVAYT